ncbi:MAG TPA: hypothetical protein VJB82_02030 [Candidatus Peribacterales bacterium]|nr:hypothetical protein [Candidatus Peribacterales bacterium]
MNNFLQTNAEEPTLPTIFTGENRSGLENHLKDSFYRELMGDRDSLFGNCGIDLTEYLHVVATHPARCDDAVIYQIFSTEINKRTDECRRVLLHPDVTMGSNFETIETEVRENLLSSPNSLLGFLQSNVDSFPENVILLPCVQDLTKHLHLKNSHCSVKALLPISADGILERIAEDRMEALDEIMEELEQERRNHPNSTLAIGCERGSRWILRMYRLTFQPEEYFISRIFPDEKSIPENVTISHAYRPNDNAGYEKEPRVDDTVNLQPWNDFTDEDVKRFRDIIVACAENNDVWILCRLAVNNKGTLIVSLYLKPHEE